MLSMRKPSMVKMKLKQSLPLWKRAETLGLRGGEHGLRPEFNGGHAAPEMFGTNAQEGQPQHRLHILARYSPVRGWRIDV